MSALLVPIESMSPSPFIRATHRTLVALCLVALQLVAALHFSLVTHTFNAGLNGFVHVHGARPAQAPLEQHRAVSLVADSASCVAESCPVGFAGHHSLLIGSTEAPQLLAIANPCAQSPASPYFAARSRVLLSAPKTSPPS